MRSWFSLALLVGCAGPNGSVTGVWDGTLVTNNPYTILGAQFAGELTVSTTLDLVEDDEGNVTGTLATGDMAPPGAIESSTADLEGLHDIYGLSMSATTVSTSGGASSTPPERSMDFTFSVGKDGLAGQLEHVSPAGTYFFTCAFQRRD